MTVTTSVQGGFTVLSSDAGTVVGAMQELILQVSALGCNKDRIVAVDGTNKFIIIKN